MSINCFPLIVVDDNGVEENELLMISLSLLQGTRNVNFSQQSVTIEIMDNDGEICMISIFESFLVYIPL